jgi:DNA-binding CsgD family transcriptional regulator
LTSAALVGREDVLRLIERVLHGLRGPVPESAVVLVEGRPGLGRSALLQRAATDARRAGARVWAARCSQAEFGLRYGVVSQLLSGISPAEQVLSELMRSVDSPEERARLHRLETELLAPATRQPLLVVVDDAQWADTHSRTWLCRMARRPVGVPTAFLFSTTPMVSLGSTLDYLDLHAMTCGRGDQGRSDHLIRLAPLGPAGVERIMAAHGHATPVDSALAETVTRMCRGNPAVLVTALRLCGGPGHHTGPANAAWLEAFRAHAAEAVTRLTAKTVGGLPEDATALMRAITVCRGDLDRNQMYRLVGLGVRSGARALALLEAFDLVTDDEYPVPVSQEPAERALARTTAPHEREELYARAAELARAGGTGPRGVARLLLGAPSFRPDWAVAVLRRAAADHRAAGEDAAAVQVLEHALSRASDMAEAALLHIDLGVAKAASAAGASQRHLELAADMPGPDRALGRLRLRAEDLLATGQGLDVSTGPFAPPGGWRVPSASPRGGALTTSGAPLDPLPGPARTAMTAWHLAATGKICADRAATRAKSALQSMRGTAVALGSPLYTPCLTAALTLLVAEDFDGAAASLEALVTDAVIDGVPGAAVLGLALRSAAYRRQGRMRHALADCRRISELARADRCHPRIAPLVAVAQSSRHIESGELDLAERELDIHVTPRAGVWTAVLLFCRGEVRRALGRQGPALDDMLGCGRGLTDRGWTNPALLPWRGRAAVLARDLGDRRLAARLADEELKLALGWGSARAIERAANTSRLILGPDTDPHPAASSEPQSGLCPTPYERRPPSASAASSLATGLTPAEALVATLAAQGLTNRAIADKLSINLRTVELRLTRVYRKLGIADRAGLCPVVAVGPGVGPGAGEDHGAG